MSNRPNNPFNPFSSVTPAEPTVPAGPPAPEAPSQQTPVPPNTLSTAPQVQNTPQVHIHGPPIDQAPKLDAEAGLDPLLIAVANLNFSDIPQPTRSRYVPCLIMFFEILSTLDTCMEGNDRFSRSANGWFSLISRYYCSVLVIIHIMRVQREHDHNLDQDTIDFIDEFLTQHKANDLFIPGPLVPFFKSICSFNVPAHLTHLYRNVVPNLPSIANFNVASNLQYGQGIDFVFPNPLLIVDQLTQLVNYDPDGVNLDAWASSRTLFFRSIFHVGAAINAPNLPSAYNPVVRGTISSSKVLVRRAADRLLNVTMSSVRYNLTGGDIGANNPNNLPSNPATPATPANTAFTWAMILGLRNLDGSRSDLFEHSQTLMQKYCGYVRHSLTLQDIPTASIASASPIFRVQANASLFPAPPTIVTATPTYRVLSLSSLGTTSNHGYLGLETLAEQYATATMLNMSFTGVPVPANFPARPANAFLRFGPFWNLPDIRRNRDVDPLGLMTGTIEARYVLEKSQNN